MCGRKDGRKEMQKNGKRNTCGKGRVFTEVSMYGKRKCFTEGNT